MVGANIPGGTETLSIAIYDRVQAYELRGVHHTFKQAMVNESAAIIIPFRAS